VSAYRIFRTARPSLTSARVLPIDPQEQWALDELNRRREARKRQLVERQAEQERAA